MMHARPDICRPLYIFLTNIQLDEEQYTNKRTEKKQQTDIYFLNKN